jgi:hypothetical protein
MTRNGVDRDHPSRLDEASGRARIKIGFETWDRSSETGTYGNMGHLLASVGHLRQCLDELEIPTSQVVRRPFDRPGQTLSRTRALSCKFQELVI